MFENGLQGKVALITGAGKGIGAACALKLAEAGASVVAVARTQSDLNDLAEKSDEKIVGWAMDVSASEFLQKLEAMEQLDILVNNAGTNRPEPFVDVSSENLDFVMGLNVRAAFLVSQAAVKVMMKTGDGGSVIQMSSQMGHVGSPGRTVYCMTKHAIEGLTKAMAVELAGEKIRVNSVCPTFVETPMTKPMLEDPEFRAFVERMIPMGRAATVEEIAAAVLYLAHPCSAMVTGTSLKVDGGWTAQ